MSLHRKEFAQGSESIGTTQGSLSSFPSEFTLGIDIPHVWYLAIILQMPSFHFGVQEKTLGYLSPAPHCICVRAAIANLMSLWL